MLKTGKNFFKINYLQVSVKSKESADRNKSK